MKYIRNSRIEREFAARKLERESNWPTYLDTVLLQATEEFAKKMNDRRISRSDLARMLGTSRAYVSQIMSGLPNMKLSTLFKLSFILGLRPIIEYQPLIKIDAREFRHETSTLITLETPSTTNTRKYEEFTETV